MVENNEPLFSTIDILTKKSECRFTAIMFPCKINESIERVVEVPDWSKGAFWQLLEYFYMDGFTVSLDHYIVELLCQLADLYQLEGLKHCYMGSLETGLSGENLSQMLEDAESMIFPMTI